MLWKTKSGETLRAKFPLINRVLEKFEVLGGFRDAQNPKGQSSTMSETWIILEVGTMMGQSFGQILDRIFSGKGLLLSASYPTQ